LEGIKSKRTEKALHNPLLLQEVLGKNPEHQGSRALKGIKSWKIEKTKCDQPLLQKKIQSKNKVRFWETIQNIKDLELWKGSKNKRNDKKEHDQAHL
jgi:hypothetical protein